MRDLAGRHVDGDGEGGLAGPRLLQRLELTLQQPPAPSWGSMLNTAQRFLTSSPWMAVWPGLAIFLSVLSFNLLGDGLRDALDPKER